jgi:pimeloyl-ACP methyl ester carboxylesterase
MEGTIITTGFTAQDVPASPTNMQQGCLSRERTVQPDGRRMFSIYLPPGYDPADTQTLYPVVYMLVGFNGFNEPIAEQNKPILDMLISQGIITPMIVVFPDPSLDLTFRFPDVFCQNFPPGSQCDLILPDVPPGTASYGNSFYINSALNNVNYEDYFINELIPFIDENFNTIADRNFRAVMGHSMGGYGSLILGMKHPDVFAGFGAESPTPPWMFTNPETFPVPPVIPFYDAFTLNSILIGGITRNPEGKLSPCNAGGVTANSAGFTDFVFALAGALSPNTTGGTSFLDEFQVNMPIFVNPDGTPSLIDGLFEVVDFGTLSGERSIVDKSVVLNQSVIDIWHKNDPYFQLESNVETLAKQAIYLDGGTTEPLNNLGSRMLSDLMMTNTVDNEYILYRGGHTSFLTTLCCSRNTVILKMLSAQFAAAATCASSSSSKLMGNLTIELCDNAQIEIFDGSILSIQTSRTIPDVINTNVTFKLKDNAEIHIGTATKQGGSLQIGDPFTKALLQQFNTGPDTELADHEVRSTFFLDGLDTLFEIGREGFFGVGIGITGKSNNNIPLSPKVANFWSNTSLANVKDFKFILNKGTFAHRIITSGDEEPASLFGLDLSNEYSFFINPLCARILGGGNIICTQQDPLINVNPAFVNRQIRLLHPTVQNMANNTPRQRFPTLLSNEAGVINVAEFAPNVIDPYLNNPISSSTAYTNIIKRGILKSTPEFARGDVAQPYQLNTSNLDDLCDFLNSDIYENQPIKLANASPDTQTRLAYLQDASFIDMATFEQFAFPLIERPDIEELDLPFQTIFEQGVAGIQLEFNGTNADKPDENIFNVKELIRVYNAHLD